MSEVESLSEYELFQYLSEITELVKKEQVEKIQAVSLGSALANGSKQAKKQVDKLIREANQAKHKQNFHTPIPLYEIN
ncbi:MAG: hypothetical protein AAGI66_07300 [Cyanobacteria bacterium P01_H01_bin.74]